jgi:hypothetical protein
MAMRRFLVVLVAVVAALTIGCGVVAVPQRRPIPVRDRADPPRDRRGRLVDGGDALGGR